MEHSEILHKIEEIQKFVLDSQERAAKGEAIELKWLEAEVAVICASVTALKPPAAGPIAEGLREIAGALTSLGEQLKEQQLGVKQELDTLNLRRKAAMAYQGNKPAE